MLQRLTRPQLIRYQELMALAEQAEREAHIAYRDARYGRADERAAAARGYRADMTRLGTPADALGEGE